MKVESKFNFTEIGEVDDINISELNPYKQSKTEFDCMKFVETVDTCLSELYDSEENINILSQETGKTGGSCRNEILKTRFLFMSQYSRDLFEKYGKSGIRNDSIKSIDAIALDESVPIYSMIRGISIALKNYRRPVILHNEKCPITSMTLSNNIYEKMRETGTLIFDVIQKNAVKSFDKNFTHEHLQLYGTHEDMEHTQKQIEHNPTEWNVMENGASIIPDKSHIEMASNSVINLSYNSISQKFLRSQVYFIQDDEYLFFKNRVIEYLKRDLKKGYGSDGDINYFNSKSQADEARESVRNLLAHGFNYVDGLHEGIHVLENQYGEDISEIEQIRGPVIVLSHYSSLRNSMDRIEKFTEPHFINIYTDSINHMDYIRERFGIGKNIVRNVEDSSTFLI